MERKSIPLHVSQLLEGLFMSSESELGFGKNNLLTLFATQVQLLGGFDFWPVDDGYAIGAQLVIHSFSIPNSLINYYPQGSTQRDNTHRAITSQRREGCPAFVGPSGPSMTD
ncbi:hypothetical protein [Pseudomonas sp. AFG_SD02_1510_Pfu_092]|uniref:hypothetical protein n=1 Tax=Pseudomonas sp. AFG_SD02_1510_Pfu_092 TaxID=2259497 RepID=UPI0031FEA170